MDAATENQHITFAMLPTALRRYVIAISTAGAVVALASLLYSLGDVSRADAYWVALLLPVAIVAERFPVHLTHKTNLNVGTAVYIALLLLVPWWLTGAVAFAAATVAQRWRRSDVVEMSFNVGQTALYVSCAALAYDLVRPAHGLAADSASLLVAVGVASVAMHLSNSALVATAGALQLNVNPLRVWLQGITIDLTPHVTLTTLGAMGALVLIDQPLFFPVLVLPGVLVHQSVKRTTQLRVDTHEALATLVEVIELQDPYTAGHSHRVAALARIIALRLGATAEEADLIEQAGRVHDLGKIGVDTAVLTKPGKLTEEEWVQMKLHPVHGANVIDHFATYRRVAKLVRHHHESWDGRGYPDGLVGEAIPFGSRMLAVADTFDALTTNRPYRRGKSTEEAIAILDSGAGKQWDARIVEAFVGYLRETGGDVPSHHPVPVPEPVAMPDQAVAIPA